MHSSSISSLLATLTLLNLLQTTSIATARSILPRQSSSNGYVDPTSSGGSMLTDSYNGFGEPLNIILSGNSDAQVLTADGFLNYALSLDFGQECLGLHAGGYQAANLGDGAGLHNQTGILRENFGNQEDGTCQESINGGNHFRYWKQNGTSADTNAYFIAASIEKNLTYGHDIEANGYDLGRDNLVSRANVTSGTSNAGVTYHTSVQMVSGLLQSGSSGVNHGITIDGLVAVMTVKASGTQSSSASSSSSSGTSSSSNSSTSAGDRGFSLPLQYIAILPVALLVFL